MLIDGGEAYRGGTARLRGSSSEKTPLAVETDALTPDRRPQVEPSSGGQDARGLTPTAWRQPSGSTRIAVSPKYDVLESYAGTRANRPFQWQRRRADRNRLCTNRRPSTSVSNGRM